MSEALAALELPELFLVQAVRHAVMVVAAARADSTDHMVVTVVADRMALSSSAMPHHQFRHLISMPLMIREHQTPTISPMSQHQRLLALLQSARRFSCMSMELLRVLRAPPIR